MLSIQSPGADVRKREGERLGQCGQKQTKAEGVNFGRYFAYVLYGWPLRPNVHNCYQWWL